MRKELKASIFLMTILFSLALFGLGIVHADPDTVDLHPTAHTILAGITVTNPANAYDDNQTTFASFNYKQGPPGGFEVHTFTTPAYNYSISSVDFKMNYSAEDTSAKGEYQISYYVNPSSTQTILQAWTSTPRLTPSVDVWTNQAEPNDGTWTWTDISNIRFTVETKKISGGGSFDFEEYEAWVTVTGVKPDTKFYVHPSSIIDYGLTPQTNKTIRPNADGTYQTWTGDYTDWDETTQNGDTDYVKATFYGMLESSQLENPTHPSWTIANVRVVVYARTNVTTNEELVLMLVIGGTQYYSNYPGWPKAGNVLTTSYEKYTWDWGKNPDTGNYWTWSDIDALEAGVESNSPDYIWTTSEMRVTQLYVEVEGPRLTVDVAVSNVEDLWAYTFILDYNTTILTATSYTSLDPYTYAWPSEINDTAGYVSVSYSKPTGQPGEDTGLPNFNMTLMQIAFLVEGLGETDLDMHSTKLSDSVPSYISHLALDGYFRNQAAVPEFPFGMVMELSLIAAIAYVWWKRKKKTKILKYPL